MGNRCCAPAFGSVPVRTVAFSKPDALWVEYGMLSDRIKNEAKLAIEPLFAEFNALICSLKENGTAASEIEAALEVKTLRKHIRETSQEVSRKIAVSFFDKVFVKYCDVKGEDDKCWLGTCGIENIFDDYATYLESKEFLDCRFPARTFKKVAAQKLLEFKISADFEVEAQGDQEERKLVQSIAEILKDAFHLKLMKSAHDEAQRLHHNKSFLASDILESMSKQPLKDERTKLSKEEWAQGADQHRIPPELRRYPGKTVPTQHVFLEKFKEYQPATPTLSVKEMVNAVRIMVGLGLIKVK